MTRKPAVSGMFYPANQQELKETINRFLEESKETKFSGKLKALIVPHAGYPYSGIVAAAGFKLLKPNQFQKVILLGPTHQFPFQGAAIATQDFETPLGIVKVGNFQDWLKEDQILELDEAHAQEHCLEVELPFLQETLADFELYALVLGEINEEKLAATLTKFIDPETLVVVSSDLSHFHDYQTAVRKDQQAINNILNFNFHDFEACGEKPIKVLMHLAKKLNWHPFLIDYQNSGDTAGDKSRVVGYVSIGFYEK